MSAMTISTPQGPMSVKQLEDYLAEMRAQWTDEDTAILGEFDQQQINMFRTDGIGACNIYYHGGLDFVIVPADPENGG